MGEVARIFVTGGSGRVARALSKRFPSINLASHADLDVCDPSGVRQWVRGAECIIHLAALTDVDECERYPERASRVNHEGTRNVAEAAAHEGAHLIYLSTDYVFDGSSEVEYSEEDRPAPLNAYGMSKLGGESEVLKYARGLVVRSSWIFGEGPSFVDQILTAARARGEISVVSDQRSRPTGAHDLAEALLWLAKREATGIIHVCGHGMPCSRLDLAEATLSFAGIETEIKPISSQDFANASEKLIAPRPRNSAMSLDRARLRGVPLADWRQCLKAHIQAG